MSVVVGLLAVAVITLALLSGSNGGSTSAAPAMPRLTAERSGPLTSADGLIPTGTTVEVDADVPAIRRLDPALRSALQRAAADAADSGVQILVTSGWRSRAYQQYLLDQATAERGATAARRLVQTPSGSRHTVGKAVDVGFTDADDWLNRNGAAYGLCQVYANEIWHFELLTSAGGTCPELLADGSAG